MSYDTVNFFRFCHHRYDPISEKDNISRLVNDMAFRLENRFGIQLDGELCLSRIGQHSPSYASVYWHVLRTIFPDESKTILGDKESMAWTKIPAFLEMFPNGKAIVLVRDPRDVVNSFKKITIAPKDDYLIALFNVMDAINYAVRLSTLYPDKVYMIRFEGLKLYPEEETRKLCRFLEVDFVPGMLDPQKFTDHSGNKWDSTHSRSFPEETDPLAPVGRWKKGLKPEDLFLCEWIAGRQISLLKLPLSGNRASPAEFSTAIKKLMSSKLLREAFKRWSETGEGMERFPLDPTNPQNWDPSGVKNPDVFSDNK